MARLAMHVRPDVRAAAQELEAAALQVKDGFYELLDQYQELYCLFIDEHGLLPLGRIKSQVSDTTETVLKALAEAKRSQASRNSRQAVSALHQQPDKRNKKTAQSWCIPFLDLFGIFGSDLGQNLARELLNAGPRGWQLEHALPALLEVASDRRQRATQINNAHYHPDRRAPTWKPTDWTAAQDLLRSRGHAPLIRVGEQHDSGNNTGEHAAEDDAVTGLHAEQGAETELHEEEEYGSQEKQETGPQEEQENELYEEEIETEQLPHQRRKSKLFDDHYHEPQRSGNDPFEEDFIAGLHSADSASDSQSISADSDIASAPSPERSRKRPLTPPGGFDSPNVGFDASFSSSALPDHSSPSAMPGKGKRLYMRFSPSPAKLKRSASSPIRLRCEPNRQNNPKRRRRESKDWELEFRPPELNVDESQSILVRSEVEQEISPEVAGNQQTPCLEDDSIDTEEGDTSASPSTATVSHHNESLSYAAQPLARAGSKTVRAVVGKGPSLVQLAISNHANGTRLSTIREEDSCVSISQDEPAEAQEQEASQSRDSHSMSRVEKARREERITIDDEDKQGQDNDGDDLPPLAAFLNPEGNARLGRGRKLDDDLVYVLLRILTPSTYHVVHPCAVRGNAYRPLRNKNQGQLPKVIIPVNVQKHWILVYVEPVSGQCKVVDPAHMVTIHDETASLISRFLSKLPWGERTWQYRFMADSGTQQDDSSCGVFIILDALFRTQDLLWPQRVDINVARFAFLQITSSYSGAPAGDVSVYWTDFSSPAPETPALNATRGYAAIKLAQAQAARLLAAYERDMRIYQTRLEAGRATAQTIDHALRLASNIHDHDESKLQKVCRALHNSADAIGQQDWDAADRALLCQAGVPNAEAICKQVRHIQRKLAISKARKFALAQATDSLGKVMRDLAIRQEEARIELLSG